MELRDLTTGKVVFHLSSQYWPDRIGVAHVEEFKSTEGVPIFRDHRYELTAESTTLPASTRRDGDFVFVPAREKSFLILSGGRVDGNSASSLFWPVRIAP